MLPLGPAVNDEIVAVPAVGCVTFIVYAFSHPSPSLIVITWLPPLNEEYVLGNVVL